MANFPIQLPSESPQAYEAACAYFGMGADRSTAHVAQTLGKSKALMDRWSSQHDWVVRARQYDGAVQQDIAAEHTRRYLADLDDHRKRYNDAGKVLYGLANKLAIRFNNEIGTFELTPQTLSVLLRAYQTAGDLEAHALGIDQLMPKLQGGDDDRRE